ncbi:hypothetical protein E2C01_022191 [Portunus trituberculatus]|uniref:Uncharacterized protein n=1 Tax=Portunus trituberculatus TaxID=210409 RepID=A0A5B7E6L3_PORTR|nr:hypothetical protein [Portunus trituberculatus]
MKAYCAHVFCSRPGRNIHTNTTTTTTSCTTNTTTTTTITITSFASTTSTTSLMHVASYQISKWRHLSIIFVSIR